MLAALKYLYKPPSSETILVTGTTNVGTPFELDGAKLLSIQADVFITNPSDSLFASTVINIYGNFVFLASHGYVTGTEVTVSSSLTLPSPLIVATKYYIIKLDNSNFGFATTLLNATNGVFIDLTTQGTGNITVTPTVTVQTFLAAAVNVAANTITLTNHRLLTGVNFQVANPGTLPGGIAAATTYFSIVIDANTIKVATTYANAIAGTALTILDQGVGTNTVTLRVYTATQVLYQTSDDLLSWVTRQTFNSASVNSPNSSMFDVPNPTARYARISCTLTQGQSSVVITPLTKGG